jgi:two-component system, cell cycle response regulator DivK
MPRWQELADLFTMEPALALPAQPLYDRIWRNPANSNRRGGAVMALTVLIVEDYEDTRALLELIFGCAGHTVVSAADGEAAVRMARAHRPDVILMDLSLPLCGGLEAARRIQRIASLSAIPIVAHTAKPDSLDAVDHPFVRVLAKPCPPDVVLAAVEAQAPPRQRVA